jgi:hypothetical protein
MKTDYGANARLKQPISDFCKKNFETGFVVE